LPRRVFLSPLPMKSPSIEDGKSCWLLIADCWMLVAGTGAGSGA
jgi:hypothetical protein